MSEVDSALVGARPFGMSFVRSACTSVTVSVHRIIASLHELAPGRYRGLDARFRAIQESIGEVLKAASVPSDGELVLPLEGVDGSHVDQVGGKMAAIGEVGSRLGLTVPAGFVVTAAGFRRLMAHGDLQAEVDRRVQATSTDDPGAMFRLSSSLQQLLLTAPIPPDLEEAILTAYAGLEERLGEGVRVSLRSSALGEDSAQSSFAGQYRSELNVGPETLLEAYREVVASKYSVPAMTYRTGRGLRDEDVAMCVGCMAMVDADAGGVAYSVSPVSTDDRTAVVSAVVGLPKAVVDGTTACDTFEIRRAPPLEVVERDVRVKQYRLASDPEEGLARVELEGGQRTLPAISDEEAVAVADLALRLEAHYGHPVDVEWALTPERRVVVLQCRPLLRVEGPVPAAGGERWTGDVVPLAAGGVTASPGAGCGPVVVVRRHADLLRFPDGAVLVTAQSLPAWASLLGRAAAVVTEQGSVTSHLASVAREFRVPALFAVDGALEVLREGETVTVDAGGRVVLPGRVEQVLAMAGPPPSPMLGSPVHAVLAEAARFIVPLNLLDPQSPHFRARSCTTLHDITRFCHEKAVDEMFRFGRDHDFHERSSKQLVTDVPMQLWVLNLDDGFTHEVEGQYVELGSIASIPMLAVWEGMQAVPWQGPPPVDSRGLLAVMFQATVNPDLDPATASGFVNRNYFLISKNYCSLQSRFGFHFATVEALVSERDLENYVSFQFKGGAADQRRRVARALLVGEILRRHGFRTEAAGDSMRARVEGYDQAKMCERLKVVGYLIVHTRQLDMIMANEGAVAEYRRKMEREIDGILSGSGTIAPEPDRS